MLMGPEITFAFIFMVVLIIQSTFSAPRRFVRIAAVLGVSLGPACATIAAVVVSDVAKQILVPAPMHRIFSCGCWCITLLTRCQIPTHTLYALVKGFGAINTRKRRKIIRIHRVIGAILLIWRASPKNPKIATTAGRNKKNTITKNGGGICQQ